MEKDKPLVSIIIPVYNGANYLNEAIDSALSQSYKNIEIIVVNDGSNDNGATERVALAYGDKIKYIAKENGGSSSALNVGIKNMTGEWFSWLSHDDLYMPEKIENSIEKIDLYKDNQIIICGSELMDEVGNKIFHPKKQLDGELTANILMERFSKNYNINGCSVLVPKKVIDEVGFFDESLVYVNDTDYWYRLMLNNCTFTCFTESLVKTRIHGGQVSVKKAELYQKERKILEEKVFNSLLNKKDVDLEKVKSLTKFTLLHGDIEVSNEVIAQMKKRGIKCAWYYAYMPKCVFGKGLTFAKKAYKRIFFGR